MPHACYTEISHLILSGHYCPHFIDKETEGQLKKTEFQPKPMLLPYTSFLAKYHFSSLFKLLLYPLKQEFLPCNLWRGPTNPPKT